jgi:ABC-type phosphate transport system substrate-binding protein
MNQLIKVFILGFICVAFAGAFNSLVAQEVVVIVNKDNPVSTMSQIEVKLYYMRKIKQQWPALGVAILPVGLKSDSPAKSSFHSVIMKMSESELEAYFKQRQFSNAEAMPATFNSENDIIDYVSRNKGAIAYVSKASYEASSGKVKSVLAQ